VDTIEYTKFSGQPAQRAAGLAQLGCASVDGRTRLRRLYQDGSAKIRLPTVSADPLEAVLINTAGGLTGGDRLAWDVDVGAYASASITTQACEKVYRAASDHAEVLIKLTVGENGRIDWLPQETIVFEGARLKRRTMADVAPGGALLACEMVVLGRAASGERFTGGLVLDAWSVRRAGKLAWTDTLRVEGETPNGAGFGQANALATIIGVWDEPEERFERARSLLDDTDKVRAGVTLVNGIMVARLLGEATAIRAATTRFLGDFRGRRLPRVWN
jgi:urease accessory protein